MNLKPLVNDKELYDAFLEEIKERIEASRNNLEQFHDPTEIYRYQGEIRALRRLLQLREKVNTKDQTNG